VKAKKLLNKRCNPSDKRYNWNDKRYRFNPKNKEKKWEISQPVFWLAQEKESMVDIHENTI
jgi:hypothetical protein